MGISTTKMSNDGKLVLTRIYSADDCGKIPEEKLTTIRIDVNQPSLISIYTIDQCLKT